MDKKTRWYDLCDRQLIQQIQLGQLFYAAAALLFVLYGLYALSVHMELRGLGDFWGKLKKLRDNSFSRLSGTARALYLLQLAMLDEKGIY